VDDTAQPRFAGWLRQHADFCDSVAAPLYGVLLRGMADDYLAGGPCRELFSAWVDRPRSSVVQLRLLGALHRVVLRREAPELATYYRSVGGTAAPAGAWPVARAVILHRLDEVRGELDVAPQTNEPGRAAALAAGLAVAAGRHRVTRIRLLELGASAGLNLLVDRFRITGPTAAQGESAVQGEPVAHPVPVAQAVPAVPAAAAEPLWMWGPAGSPVDLSAAVRGPGVRRLPPAGELRIVARRGCDLHPVDPLSEAGRLRLTSFVWPDHADRHRRLAGALAVATAAGPGAAPVDRADAGAWLAEQLDQPVAGDVLTVVWHSVFWQYLDDAARAGLEGVIAAARGRIAVAHLRLESGSAPYHVDPALVLDGEVLGSAPPHGVPVTLDELPPNGRSVDGLAGDRMPMERLPDAGALPTIEG